VLERASFLRQLVLHPHRRFRNHDPRQDAFRFELAQPLGEHPIADVGNRAPQFRKPHPPVQEQLNHGARPPAANQLDGPMKLDAELGFEAHRRILAK
jgi:hypothetical protein